jgi:tetratricopeptide (TPR) repeat protein
VRDISQNLTLFVIAVAGLAVAIMVSSYSDKHRPTMPSEYEDQDLAVEGKRLKGFALGAEGLLADAYWMASLQYIGGKLVHSEEGLSNIENLRSLNPRLLHPYLENSTELDPKFVTAYSYGAIVLPAIDQDKAIALTEKGIANNPDEWRLYHYLGYIYWRLNNYQKAAEVYEKGSAITGAPPFMKMMSASMRNEGGSRSTARVIYQQMLGDSTDQQSRDVAQLRLFQLDSLDERDVIGKALENYKEQNGRCAVAFREIFPLLRTARTSEGKTLHIDITGNPVDPTGEPYILNTAECTIDLSPKSRVPRV